jgi:protein-disulfide isomerase
VEGDFLIYLIRSSWCRFAFFTAMLFCALPATGLVAEEQPQGEALAAQIFPKPDPANFTASAPSLETVNAFLKNYWGYDSNRIWQVQAIWKTPAAGLSEVLLFVADKSENSQPGVMVFFVTPDGKHFLQTSFGIDLGAFGQNPNAEIRTILQQRADGPTRGAKSKAFEIVEMVDYQCPFCKLQHADLEQMLKEFPNAHYVFQPIPLTYIHGASALAATYGYCVAKEAGNDAFFRYTDAVFDGQEKLNAPETARQTLDNAARTAGTDVAKISACVASPEAKAQVESWGRLAQDLAIHIPTIAINGRLLPEGHYPYERLREIIAYQAKHDGVAQ